MIDSDPLNELDALLAQAHAKYSPGPCPSWCPDNPHEWVSCSDDGFERLHTSDRDSDAFVCQYESNTEGAISFGEAWVNLDLTLERLNNLTAAQAHRLAAQLQTAATLADEINANLK